MTRSAAQDAYDELITVLRDAGEHVTGPGWQASGADQQADALRTLSHILQSALYTHQESDPERPHFDRIVSPTRSFTGDNPDALYFEAPVLGDREYRVRGNLAGAVYTSFTLDAGGLEGRYPTGIAGVLRDDDIDVDADGSYEIRLGGPAADRNWLPVPPEGGRITTRHYFEWTTSAAASQTLHIPLAIEPLRLAPPRPRWDDASVAAALRRVVNHVRGKTLDRPRPGGQTLTAPWVSTVPNVFAAPTPPGTLAYAAYDAAYSMAPYALADDEALVITGRWPDCRFANVCLWTEFQQMYGYTSRSVSRNRATTRPEADGTFRMVLAHADPGVPNWLDTEGRGTGTLFWRFFLPQGPVETPQAEVVPFSRVRSG